MLSGVLPCPVCMSIAFLHPHSRPHLPEPSPCCGVAPCTTSWTQRGQGNRWGVEPARWPLLLSLVGFLLLESRLWACFNPSSAVLKQRGESCGLHVLLRNSGSALRAFSFVVHAFLVLSLIIMVLVQINDCDRKRWKELKLRLCQLTLQVG